MDDMSELYSGGNQRSSMTKSQRKKWKNQAQASYKKGDKIRKMIENLRVQDEKDAESQLENELSTLPS